MTGIELAEKAQIVNLPGKARRRSRSNAWRDYLWGYAMIAPLMVGLLIFYIWPVLQNFYFSFTSWNAFGKYKWTGPENYQKLFKDPDLLHAFGNTLLFTVLTVPVGIFLSILVAVLLNQKVRGLSIYRTLYFLPSITMPAAIALVWGWLYNGDYGLINQMLKLVGIQGPRWIADPKIAFYSVVIVSIWGSIGHNMIMFLAGLQSISSTYYEAASLDGAGSWQRFWRITMPLLSPTVFFSTIVSLIGAFQVFDLVFLMSGKNSLLIEATQTVVYLFYSQSFIQGDKGYAAAIAMLLFVIILLITIVQFRLQRRWVHYA